MDFFLWRPVLVGSWRQREMFDGTYDFQDLVEINRALDVHEENKRRSMAAGG